MKELNITPDLSYEKLIKRIENEARKEADINDGDELESFQINFSSLDDYERKKKVCITIGGKEK